MSEKHTCYQAGRLRTIEDELAKIEARRREDAALTAHTLRDLASQFGDAVERMKEAGDTITSVSKQIRALFARMDALNGTKE